METTGSGEFSSKRNKAIIHALCNRFSLNQENILSDISGSLDIINLVAYFFQSSGNDISISENQIEVTKWATFAGNISENKDACHSSLKDLNEHLTLKSVLLGGLKTSVADVIVFSALHDFVSHLTNEDAQKYPNVMRWADYIQNKEDFDGAFDLISINKLPFGHFQSTGLKDANQTAKNIVESSKGASKSVRDTNSVNDLREAAANDKVSINSKNGSKGSNVNASLEQTKKSTEKKTKPSDKELSEKDTECPITLLNMQVGLILKAWKHPSADSLLVEEIDLGDNNQRQVVSGLAKYYSPDDLIGRHVVLITNVKPGKLRDVMSSGLVLCASNQELTTVEPIIPPEGAKIGERISFSGFEGKPEDVLNPKKKQLEKITPHLYTDEVGVPRYRGLLFMTSVGPCTSSIPNGAIK